MKKAILTIEEPDKLLNGTWTCKTSQLEVEVMAIAKGYAMVRRSGCMPFVCRAKDLSVEVSHE